MFRISKILTAAFLLIFFAAESAFALNRSSAESLRQQRLYRARSHEFFKNRQSEPFVPGTIQVNWRNRGDFTRHYGQSVVNFATRAFYFNEQNEEANKALIEICDYHIERPQTLLEIHSFPWFSRQMARLCKFYGPDGTVAANRMDKQAYEKILETYWIWLSEKSNLEEAEYEQSETMDVYHSENHHINYFATCWMFASVLKSDENYSGRKLPDGETVEHHYDTWSKYASEYLMHRAKKGMQVEIASPSYATATLGAVYFFYDFAEDQVLKRRADYFITLYWALWAQENLNGVRGGGKTRCTPSRSLGGQDFMRSASYYYFGFGDSSFDHASMLPFVTSSWRMPPIVHNIGVNASQRGVYEIMQRRLGLAVDDYFSPPRYRLNGDYGGILRYSYCTPDFIIGSLMTEARDNEDWTAISSQNRWQGVIFKTDVNARIYPQAGYHPASNYNQQWAVQNKGTLISQKLKQSRGTRDMMVWFSDAGISEPVEKGSWVFAQAGNAFAAVKAVSGGYSWQDETARNASGKWMKCEEEFTPVIIEVACKDMFDTLKSFADAVIDLPIKFQDNILTYKSVYGDEFTFFADYSQTPKINGEPIDYAPKKVYESPFLNSVYDSGVVIISMGDEKIVLDFTKTD